MKELLDSRCVHSCPDGVKLLGDGAEKFTTPITIYVSRASDTAIAAVEAAGGKIYTVYHNRLGLRSLLKPYKFAERGLPKQAQPTRRDMIEYYKNPKKRGFLANEEEGKNEYHALLALKGVEGKMPKAVEA
ncbi:YmL10 [Saitoella coloradoensis]